jgi:20S proteasome subunit alpha 5
MEIDEHIGCAMSGLTADARTLVEHGRVETQVGFVISLSLSLSLSLCVPSYY